jgi:predicted house-cleaning noncanonical NTP pyrophosphatase (MazG superfamily)
VKLIRDQVPALLAANGQPCAYHLATPTEYEALLRATLLEETHQAAQAPSRAALLDELGDVLQVLYALAALAGYGPAEVEHARARKARVHGGYARGIVWHGPQPETRDGAA